MCPCCAGSLRWPAGVPEVDPQLFDDLRVHTYDYLKRVVRDAATLAEHSYRMHILAIDAYQAVVREGLGVAVVGLGLSAHADLPNNVPPASCVDWAAAVSKLTHEAHDPEADESDNHEYERRKQKNKLAEPSIGLVEPDYTVLTATELMLAEPHFMLSPAIAELPFERYVRKVLGDLHIGLPFEPRGCKVFYAGWEARMLRLLADARAISNAPCVQPAHLRVAANIWRRATRG